MKGSNCECCRMSLESFSLFSSFLPMVDKRRLGREKTICDLSDAF